MEMVNIDPFYILTVVVGLIVWFSRLEAKTLRNEKDIARMLEKHETLESELIRDLNEVKLALARIEVKMESKKEE